MSESDETVSATVTKAHDAGPPSNNLSKLMSIAKTAWPIWHDFFEKLILLIIGFVFTIWLGNHIAETYRRDSARKEAMLAAMRSDLAQAMETFQSISQLMDKRIFRMRRLHDVYSGAVGKEFLEQRLKDYREVFMDWNDNLNRNLALYSFHFGTTSASSVGRHCSENLAGVHDGFTKVHRMLQRFIDGNSDDATKLRDALDSFNPCIFLLDQLMLQKIKEMRVNHLKQLAE